MLDNTENRRLHDLFAEVAPLISGLAEESAPPSGGYAGEPDCQPFGKDKVQRILDRVYNRLADEAAEPIEPQLRELIAEVSAQLPVACAPFSKSKIQRILDRVEAHRVAESSPATPVRTEAGKSSTPREALWVGLRSIAVAFFMPRPPVVRGAVTGRSPRRQSLADDPADHKG